MHEIANDGLGAVMCPGSTLQAGQDFVQHAAFS